MAKKNNPRFEDWKVEKNKDAEFAAAAEDLEPGYQIARLRILRGLTQAQLAERVGTPLPSIARLENGSSVTRLSFLQKVATALDARVEVKLVQEEKPTPINFQSR